jgi:hypothetical protein
MSEHAETSDHPRAVSARRAVPAHFGPRRAGARAGYDRRVEADGQRDPRGPADAVSAAVYATDRDVRFQVARVDGLSMALTLEDHDRPIVNKLVYDWASRGGRHRDALLPAQPREMFVKRVIARAGDTVRIVDGRVYVDVPLHDDYVSVEFPATTTGARR